MRTDLYDNWLFLMEDLEDGYRFGLDERTFAHIQVPHDWAIGAPSDPDMEWGDFQGYLNRWGIGWYRLHFTLTEKKKGKRYILHFDGVFERCQVYLNEIFSGEHRYGYSGFSLDITESVCSGENLLAVRVDNSLTTADRWYSGCGIYRKVELEEVSERYLKAEEIAVHVDYKDGSGSLIIEMEKAQTGVTAAIDDVFAAEIPENGILKISGLSVEPWSAENPRLYRLVLRLPEASGGHTLPLFVGFRRVEFIPQKGMFVNGEPVKMKGVCLHHDGGCVGSAVTGSLLKKRLKLLKSMGCNTIRTSHNIVSTEMMDLCDQLGFYVVDEGFDKWVHGAYSRFFETDMEEDLSYLIRHDRNRPCVVMWSMGNEIEDQGSASMLSILKRLCSFTRTLDDRPVTVAMSPLYKNLDGEPIEEQVEDKVASACRIADIVDIISCNYQEQWYEEIHRICPEKLILGTESYVFFRGSYAHLFNYGPENPWMDVMRHDYVIGSCLWAGIDYLGESMGFPSKGWGGTLIQTNLVRKPISYLWESYWSEKPVVHISILDYTKPAEIVREPWSELPLSDCWNYPMFVKMPMVYMIFSNCQEVRLSLNGEHFDIDRPEDCKSRIISGFLPLEPGTVLAEGMMEGQVVCSHKLVTCKGAEKLIFTELPDPVEQLPAQLLFTVTAVDDDGNPDYRESREISFVTEGPCIVEGVDNGYLCSQECFASDHIHMHQGRASVVLRVTGTGDIVVHARAKGLEEATACFHMK